MRPRTLILFAAVSVVLLAAAPAAWSATETVHLPVTLDSTMMRSLILQYVFNQPGGGQELQIAERGCTHIEIGSPQVNIGDSLMQVVCTLRVHTGIGLFGTCFKFYDWEGYVEILQGVEYGGNDFQLKFPLQEYHLYNRDKREIALPWFVRDKVHSFLYERFDQASMDLAGPIRDLKGLLPEMFEGEDRERIERSLASLRPGQGRIQGGVIRLEILVDIDTQPQPPEPVAELSPEQIDRAIAAWEPWDAFLVLEIMKLSGQPLEEDERIAILKTLVDARQGFVKALADRTLGTALVREQFVQAWQGLSSILKKHLSDQPSPNLLSYLAYFTAADALTVLDRLGPALGMDISREGLMRLAGLLVDSGPEDMLAYSYAVDAGLRDLLGFGSPLETSGPAYKEEEIEIPEYAWHGDSFAKRPWRWFGFPVRPAYAAEDGPPAGWEALAPWIPPQEKDLPAYVNRVKALLDEMAEEAVSSGGLPEKYQDMFRLLVLSTGWQESCWRQFARVGGKLRYLVSYNNSSVGIMQINERVWRGLYALDSLRWDIRYNSRAGKEILMNYLTKYALRKMLPDAPLDDDTLARATYAMYNGGPGQFDKFLDRNRKGPCYDTDNLFWQKHQLVKQGRFEQIGMCLVGKPLPK